MIWAKIAVAVYIAAGWAMALAIRATSKPDDRISIFASLLIGTLVGFPVFVICLFRAAAREVR